MRDTATLISMPRYCPAIVVADAGPPASEAFIVYLGCPGGDVVDRLPPDLYLVVTLLVAGFWLARMVAGSASSDQDHAQTRPLRKSWHRSTSQPYRSAPTTRSSKTKISNLSLLQASVSMLHTVAAIIRTAYTNRTSRVSQFPVIQTSKFWVTQATVASGARFV